MEDQLKQLGNRIREARSSLDISVREMAELHGLTEAEYLRHENGEVESSFTFLYKTAGRFGIDLNALLTGHSPHLTFYTLTRKGAGLKMARRAGFEYLHQAAGLRGREAEPFIVTAPDQGDVPIPLSAHPGQEFDLILKGSLKVQLEDKIEILHEGDSLYYDGRHAHGMIACGGAPCVFLAVVMHTDLRHEEPAPLKEPQPVSTAPRRLLYQRFMTESFDEQGVVNQVKFNIPENFNFAFDVVDELGRTQPDKRAMRWVSNDRQTVHDFTFREISENSSRAANYFRSLGIGRGDRVMLVLKRHYQFWFAINALHKIGAMAVPASNQLLCHDFEYRFNKANIKAVVCSADGAIAANVEQALPKSPSVKTLILVNGTREGWHDFNAALPLFSTEFERPAEQKATDPMLTFFSSGTTGYPKMVVHSYTYPLGHIMTARWWHNVNPDGLHFTISDTGWGKSLWGKIYGQWLCEAAVFVYDFDRFDASVILPLFKQHNITTFCAPPTMYRFFIKEDLSKYDFSSLKYACTAGEALNPEVFQQFLQATGLKIMESFGQTESTMLIGNLVGMTPKPGSMGKPNPQFEIELHDADGNKVAPGDNGEIVVRCVDGKPACGLFLEYQDEPEKNVEVRRGGWYRTGDVAWCDEDGYFWYVGRADDIIKTSGYRVGPFEVESVLMELPYVLECAITGAPDPIRGQVIKATIVLVKGRTGDDALKKEIQNYVKTHTAPYKYPRIVEFVTELPKTSSGKIRRTELRERSRQENQ